MFSIMEKMKIPNAPKRKRQSELQGHQLQQDPEEEEVEEEQVEVEIGIYLTLNPPIHKPAKLAQQKENKQKVQVLKRN